MATFMSPSQQLQAALAAPAAQAGAPGLYAQYLGAAQPAPVQPQGYQQAGGNALLDLLKQYQQPGGGFEPIAQTARQAFQEEQLPQLLAGYRGGTSGRELVKQRAMERLERELAAAGGQYRLQSQGQLGNLLQGQQQVGLQQQQQGLGGVQGIGSQIQNLGQLLANIPLQNLQALMGGQRAQAGLGLGQGGDVALDAGQAGNIANLTAQLTKLMAALG